MSIQTVKQRVLNFLSAPSPGTMSIRGAWGVGKTHAWKEYIVLAHSKNKLKNSRYSYVSLFGINSLQDLKFQIFQQAISTKMIGEEVTIKSFRENVLQLSESIGRKSFRSFFQLPYVTNFSDSLESVAFLSISKSLICIDDLERKGKNLSMTDVLGLISYLKEEKDCKVVLIHNEGMLDEDDRKEFDKYREKAIDIEFEYKPSSSECTSIAFSGNCDFHKDLIHNCNRLGIDNIRILKKIEGLAEQLLPYAQKFEPDTTIQCLHTLCLFTWCFYSSNKVSPDYGYVTNIGLRMIGLGDNDKFTEEQKRWNATLQDYGYIHTDELDLAIDHLIGKGYVTEDEFYMAAEKKNDEIIATKGQNSFSEAWNIYHNNFRNNEEEVVEQLFEALKKWVKHVSPLNLQGTVGLLRELKRNDLADEAIEYYIEQRKSETGLFDLQEYPFSGDVTDETIINQFKETFKTISDIKTRSLEEVVSKIADKNGWSKEDVQILSTATVEDYYKLFKSTEGSHLSKYIHACLQFRNFSNTSEQEKEIYKKAISALKIIGNESTLNKLRVKKLGVHID